jgi:hypothetical protein
MLIDKSKFMVLVAAISATTAGCVIVDNDGSGGGSEGGGEPSTTSSSSQGGGGAGGDATGGGGTGGDATGGGGEGGAGGGESCLGDMGTPAACSSECEATDIPGGISNCDGVQYLKGGVAVPTVECINALNPDTCSAYADGFQGCFLTNLALACHDAAVATPCSEIATACGSTDDAAWQSECSAVMSGLTEAGRGVVASCMQDFCTIGSTIQECAIDAYYNYVN